MKDKNRNKHRIDGGCRLGCHLDNGGNAESDNQIALSKAFGCTTDWLLMGLADQSIITNAIDTASEKSVESKTASIEEFALIPIAEAHLDAGGGAFVLSENTHRHYAFRRDWLKKVATSIDALILMMVQGDSMQPTIQSGDMVMLDRGRVRIHQGCIFALGMDDTIVVKKLERLAAGRVRVISDNRSEYPPYETDLNDIRILGQVIWYARQLVRVV